MNVPSFSVLGFAVLGAIVFNLSRALAWRRCVLLVLNLAFFATFAAGVVSVLPYVLFLAAGFIAMRMTERSRSRRKRDSRLWMVRRRSGSSQGLGMY